MKKGVLAVILLVVALLALTTSVASADQGSQKWNLDGDQQMEKVGGPGDDGQSGSVTIGPKSSVVFVADEASAPAGGVTFSASNKCGWTASFALSAAGDAHWVDAQVGIWDGATFTPFNTTDTIVTITSEYGVEIMFQVNSETVPQGDYLALSVYNTNGAKSIDIMTGNDADGCSWLVSPCTDPGYPTPELATIVLMSIGVLGLATGYLFIRRRQAGQAA